MDVSVIYRFLQVKYNVKYIYIIQGRRHGFEVGGGGGGGGAPTFEEDINA